MESPPDNPVNGAAATEAAAALHPPPPSPAEQLLTATVQEFAQTLGQDVQRSGGNIDGFQIYLQQRLQYIHIMALTQELAAADPAFDGRVCARMTIALRQSIAELNKPKIALAVSSASRNGFRDKKR